MDIHNPNVVGTLTGGGGGGSDTPWTEDHDTAGYALTTADGAQKDIVISTGSATGQFEAVGDILIKPGSSNFGDYSSKGKVIITGGDSANGHSAGDVEIHGGVDTNDDGTGGNVYIRSGAADNITGSSSGDIWIEVGKGNDSVGVLRITGGAGNNVGAGSAAEGGEIIITAGQAGVADGKGGDITIEATKGDSPGPAAGGEITIISGQGEGSAKGGDITLTAGFSDTGADGTIILGGVSILKSFVKGALPSVIAGGVIYVSDATGSSLTGSMCFSNGAVWIDVTTGIAVA